jgi:hypothetical protein
MIFGRAIIPLRFLFVRDLFRKPVPTFRDHALVPFCHSVNALGAPRDVTARPGSCPWLDFIQAIAAQHVQHGRPTRCNGQQSRPQFVMHRRSEARDDMACERALMRSGQALSTMIVVPQIGLPLLLV